MIRSVIVLAALFLYAVSASAEPAETLEQARELSVASGKPILMEFVHED